MSGRGWGRQGQRLRLRRARSKMTATEHRWTSRRARLGGPRRPRRSTRATSWRTPRRRWGEGPGRRRGWSTRRWRPRPGGR
eukprot:3203291-Pyramimonas_sp.AAC.1